MTSRPVLSVANDKFDGVCKKNGGRVELLCSSTKSFSVGGLTSLLFALTKVVLTAWRLYGELLITRGRGTTAVLLVTHFANYVTSL